LCGSNHAFMPIEAYVMHVKQYTTYLYFKWIEKLN
jgi:heme/copper-type cytochrome/quinol oxidase subunit 2